MENDLNIKNLKESLNTKNQIKNINPNLKEEEIKNDTNENTNNIQIINNDMNNDTKENKNVLNVQEECSKNIEIDDKDKKINNKRVNNLLKDIYGSLSKINEVNDRVKNILSKRKKLNSVNSFRVNYQVNKESNIKNKRKSTTANKTKITYKIKEKNGQNEYSTEKISHIYNRNTYNNENDLTKNETGSDNLKSKNTNIIALTKLDNTCSDNQTKKSNSFIYNKLSTPEQFNRTEKTFDIPKFFKYEELKVNDKSPDLNSKNIENSNINSNNSVFYDEEYENEKIIRYMKSKLKNEEKKLRVLEEQKNKLLNEEKIRRKILMEKIRIKNRMKKKCLINEYKTKISKIQKLQSNNINEIRKLEIKKKIDEENIIKIEKICENININDSCLKSNISKSQKRSSLTKSKFENSSDGFNCLLSDNESQNKSISKKNLNSNFCIYSNNYLEKQNKNKSNYINESEEGLTEEYQFNNSINELTSTCDMNEENTFSYTQDDKKSSYKRKLNFDEVAKTKKDNINPFNYLYNYYQKVNNSNNINNIKSKNLNVENYLNQNSKKKRYNSESRKYNKSLNNINPHSTKRKEKGSFTPNQGVLSFIKTKVNKYNHSSNKGNNLSKRLSQITAYPSCLIDNINCKYNYKYTPSTGSRTRCSSSRGSISRSAPFASTTAR